MKAKMIFNTANTYARSSIILNKNSDLSQLIPSQVMAALSLECYFKCIYFIENRVSFQINGRPSHDFYVLFSKLQSETQKIIIDEYNKLLSSRNMNDIEALESTLKIKINTNFDAVLKEWSKMFVDVRYIHEVVDKNQPTIMIMYPELQSILHSHINRIINC